MHNSDQLSPQDLAELAIHLYDSGDVAFRQQDLRQAHSWYAQSLSVFGQLQADNTVWIAALLLSLGKIAVSLNELEHAGTFFEACSNLCQLQPQDSAIRDYQRDLARLFIRINRPESKSRTYPAHEFIITAAEVVRRKVRITTDGQMEWIALQIENAQPLALGLQTIWKVIPTH